MTILPMTRERVGRGVQEDHELPTRITSIEQAFAHFRPLVRPSRDQDWAYYEEPTPWCPYESLADLEEAARKCNDDVFLEEAAMSANAINALYRSYSLVKMFFAEANATLQHDAPAVELFIFNADVAACPIDEATVTARAVERFVSWKCGSIDFYDGLATLVAPGHIAGHLRTRLEQLSALWGMVFITDLPDRDDVSEMLDVVATESQIDGATSLLFAGWLSLSDGGERVPSLPDTRPALTAPASMLLAGTMARLDCDPSPTFARASHLVPFVSAVAPRMEFRRRHIQLVNAGRVVAFVRDEENELRLKLMAPSNDEVSTVWRKCLTPYRIARYVERRLDNIWRTFSPRRCTPGILHAEILAPTTRLLDDLKRQGLIEEYQCDLSLAESRVVGDLYLNANVDVRPTGMDYGWSISTTPASQ